MIIWSGLGILIPLVAIVGLVAGTVLGTALGFPVAGIGLGFLLAATGNWGLWKLVYPETPKVLIDPATGQQVVINPKHGLFFIPARAWTWILGFFAIPAVLLGVIGEKAAAENAAKPGYSQFSQANDMIDSHRDGIAHGNSEAAKNAAAEFSTHMKAMSAALFTGGSKKNLMTGGDFLTYCHEGPDTVTFLCHVPSLRSYKSEEAKEGLNMIAWSIAKDAVTTMDPEGGKTLTVGLRGMTTYGSIQQGKTGPDAADPTLAADEPSIFYPAFAVTPPAAVE